MQLPLCYNPNITKWPNIGTVFWATVWTQSPGAHFTYLTSLSSNCLPMRHLKANTMFAELTTAWHFAGRPTRRLPCFVKATMDGVVRAPSEFSMTRDILPSMMDTHEFVVPKSMPMTWPETMSANETGPDRRLTCRWLLSSCSTQS